MNIARRLAAGATASVLVVTLAACASGPSEPAAVPTPTQISETPSPQPTPVETASPAIDPQDPSTWLVTDAGIGPVELGAPLPGAIALMPEGTRHDTENCGWTAWWSAPDGSYQFVAARGSDAGEEGPVDTIAAMVLPELTGISGPVTAEGIGFGSTLEEVQAAYPGVDFMDTSDGSAIGGQRFIELSDTIFLTFYEGSDTVSAVTVTTAETPPYEFCG